MAKLSQETSTKLSRETGNHRETIGKTETVIEKVTNKRNHRMPPQIFVIENEDATGNRRRKRGCCQKLLPPYLLFMQMEIVNDLNFTSYRSFADLNFISYRW
ncbi:hypothetical protein Tco_0167684 [Tanacetum coccineum]